MIYPRYARAIDVGAGKFVGQAFRKFAAYLEIHPGASVYKFLSDNTALEMRE